MTVPLTTWCAGSAGGGDDPRAWQQVIVNNTLPQDDVGLEAVDDGVYDLHFYSYQIGRDDLNTNKIRDIVSKVRVSRRQVDLAIRV